MQVTSLVVWDADFAAQQLERMMRIQGPGVSAEINYREPISAPPLKTTTFYMSQADWDDIVKWSDEEGNAIIQTEAPVTFEPQKK